MKPDAIWLPPEDEFISYWHLDKERKKGDGWTRYVRADLTDVPDDDEDFPEEKWVEFLNTWRQLFPDKTQPRQSNKALRKKFQSRMGRRHFREFWYSALKAASEQKKLQTDNWFRVEFFLRNKVNYRRCLDREWAWGGDYKPPAPDKVITSKDGGAFF